MRRRLVAFAAAVVLVASCSSGGSDERERATDTTRRSSATSSSSTTSTTGTAPTSTTATAGLNPSTTAGGCCPAGAAPAPVTGTTAPAPAAAPAAQAPACPPIPARNAPAPDRPRYDLTVDVDLAANVVRGNVAVRFTPDLDTDRLVFRLWAQSPRIAAGGGRVDTGPVTVDGRATPVERPNPTTLVVRTGPLARGRAVDVAIPYQLTLPGAVNDRVSRNGDSVRLGSFFPLLAWEPGVGWATEPPTTGFAEAVTSPAADVTATVTVPPGLTALTSGVQGGDGRFRATAVRDFAVSVGPFETATGVAHAPDEVRVTVGVTPGLGVSPGPFLAKVIRVMNDFGTRFGPYPWPSLTLAITPELGGGIEFPAHIQQGPETIGRTTSHEVGHQWFYALVGNDQGRDPWIDEGLASFAEARFENTLASFTSRPIPADARGRVGAPMTYWESRQSSYYRGVYVQGAQVLAALGDPGLVDCALRHFVARQAFRIARPADVVAAMEVVFPDAYARMAPFGVQR